MHWLCWSAFTVAKWQWIELPQKILSAIPPYTLKKLAMLKSILVWGNKGGERKMVRYIYYIVKC